MLRDHLLFIGGDNKDGEAAFRPRNRSGVCRICGRIETAAQPDELLSNARAHDRYFGGRIEDYALRHRVKPGITGWAQVNGLRGETATLEEMRRRVDFDLWYVRRARFALGSAVTLPEVHP